MLFRYEVRAEISGWTVYDVITGRPASFNGLVLGGLRCEDADNVAGLLNELHGEASSATLH